MTLSITKSAAKYFLAAKNDWDLVCKFLSYRGAFYSVIPVEDQTEIRQKAADGFGADRTDPTIIWDWSHVRDSSPQAIENMANMIRAWVAKYTD